MRILTASPGAAALAAGRAAAEGGHARWWPGERSEPDKLFSAEDAGSAGV
ncbi:MAG: hypothetical protein KY450_11640 [Actinobacteria bacterium]|nr:hypothetical protein [Actinomycetota bacterium]MBW3642167.1 hypothetical protein [Actinomycetota bacterium]